VARLAPVEKRDELERLREQIRDLQRLLGKKTLENEALRESLRGAQSGNVENVHALAPNGGGPSPLVRDGSA
jgi:transposase